MKTISDPVNLFTFERTSPTANPPAFLNYDYRNFIDPSNYQNREGIVTLSTLNDKETIDGPPVLGTESNKMSSTILKRQNYFKGADGGVVKGTFSPGSQTSLPVNIGKIGRTKLNR